jgi:hypothetical protein
LVAFTIRYANFCSEKNSYYKKYGVENAGCDRVLRQVRQLGVWIGI